jgi:ubiquitin C-terminal hydrolase
LAADLDKLRQKYTVLKPKNQEKTGLIGPSLPNKNNYSTPPPNTPTPEKQNKPNKNINIANGSDGIPEAKRNFFAAEKVFNFWKNGNRGMSGLINMGNTCFLNASIQCLLHTPALYNVLINLNNNNHQHQHKFDSLTSLARLVRTSLHQGPKGAVRPREIVENIRKIGNKAK